MSSELLMNLKEFAELGCSSCDACKNYDIDNCPNLKVVREAILLLERQGNLLKERSEGLCDVRRNWQAAEMKICSMCGKFLHGDTDTHKGDVVFATDGNGVVCGTRTCGELIGYPRCGKFTPWISVSDRLPEQGQEVIIYTGNILKPTVMAYQFWNPKYDTWTHVTHWMPLPEGPR